VSDSEVHFQGSKRGFNRDRRSQTCDDKDDLMQVQQGP